jgi:hypothetical protein
VEELLEWPWLRFEVFYEAFVKAVVIESIERRKDAMIAALWANSNFDDDKGTRRNAIEEIEANFQEAIDSVNNPMPENDIDMDNPFFNPALRGREKIEAPRNDEGTVAQNITAKDLASLDQ